MPTRSNVTHLKPSTLPLLRAASTSAQGGRIPESRNEVWLCTGYDDLGRSVVLYIKPLLSTRQIMAEVLAAQVGQCMGLPCPNPYIVTANPRHIGRKADPKIVAFGSEQAGDRSMSYPILDVDLLLDTLRRQKVDDGLSAFDEFIANPVRSPRDIFFTPDASHRTTPTMRPTELPTFEATWWPVALETVPGSGERIVIAVLARAASGQAQVRQLISPTALTGMFGSAASTTSRKYLAIYGSR